MKNLTLDVGNTRTKIALWDNDKVTFQDTIPYLTIPYLKKHAYNRKKVNCILSVTGSLTSDIESWLTDRYHNFTTLSHHTPVPIANKYRTPHTLGKDRLAAVVGAHAEFSDADCLVIDAGTCITYDLVSAAGEYLGGNISPGIRMRLKAMHQLTERLPDVAPGEPQKWLGNDTVSALRNGAQRGALLEVRGFVNKFRRRYRAVNVVFTGGDADFFVGHFKSRIFARPNLVASGLNQILKYNVAKQIESKSRSADPSSVSE